MIDRPTCLNRLRAVAVVTMLLFVPATAKAIPILVTGNSTGLLSTAAGDLTRSGNQLTLLLMNTSPFDARITGIGFDLIAGDFTDNSSDGLNGYTGNNPGSFTFRDGPLGNVPQFNSAVLDFGWTTGPSGNFAGGSPNFGIAPGGTLTFIANGNLFGLTEPQLANGLYVRFQRVGPDGEGSDVGRVGGPGPVIPEPATLLMVGTGLITVAARYRRRLNNSRSGQRSGE